jgi:hypothetical protein
VDSTCENEVVSIDLGTGTASVLGPSPSSSWETSLFVTADGSFTGVARVTSGDSASEEVIRIDPSSGSTQTVSTISSGGYCGDPAGGYDPATNELLLGPAPSSNWETSLFLAR